MPTPRPWCLGNIHLNMAALCGFGHSAWHLPTLHPRCLGKVLIMHARVTFEFSIDSQMDAYAVEGVYLVTCSHVQVNSGFQIVEVALEAL